MVTKAPGKSASKGTSVAELFRMLPDNAAAEQWFTEKRWLNGPHCPSCGSTSVQSGAAHKTMLYRCREKECRKRFSVKVGTVMEGSNLDFQTWAVAIYLSLTSLKSVSSMKLHRDLSIMQKSSWHLVHRLRGAFASRRRALSGPVEADETYMGGRRKNMSKANRQTLSGRGIVRKSVVVGVNDRGTNEVRARPVPSASAPVLQGLVREHAREGAVTSTDEATAYAGLAREFDHVVVNHSVGEYVRQQAHTNGIESFWASQKRAPNGTFHKISAPHMDRPVTEVAGKHNACEPDTLEQMAGVVFGVADKRVRYSDLITDNGLETEARS